MDIILDWENSNSIERDLENVINRPMGISTLRPVQENSSQENEIRNFEAGNEALRQDRLSEFI